MLIDKRKLLVTGCARSGTLYASRLWQALGLDIRHERPVPPDGQMGRDGIASWFMAVKDPNPPYGPSALHYQFDFIIHQVRDPLKVIASVAQFIISANKSGKQYIIANCPEANLSEQQQNLKPHEQWILQAALYWHHWNLIAERIASITVSLENLPNSLPALCEMLEVNYSPGVIDGIPQDTNARKLYIKATPWVINWQYLETLNPALTEIIRDQASRYGYL